MRINFVGNSHLGTIAPALSKGRGNRDIAHFISRTYGTVNAIVGTKTGTVDLPYIKLEKSTRYGYTIDLESCDAIVAVGLNFSLVQMVKLWESFKPVCSVGDYDVPSLGDKMWDAYLDAAFDRTFMMRMTHEFIRSGDTPVFVISQSAPAEWVSERDGDRFAIYRSLVANGDWDKVRSDFARQVRRLERNGVRVFQQPRSTLTEHGFTKTEFAMGNPSDDAEGSFYSRGDFYHMNREFANRFAPEFYEWLDESVSSQVSSES